jgi:hypothetical protein
MRNNLQFKEQTVSLCLCVTGKPDHYCPYLSQQDWERYIVLKTKDKTKEESNEPLIFDL